MSQGASAERSVSQVTLWDLRRPRMGLRSGHSGRAVASPGRLVEGKLSTRNGCVYGVTLPAVRIVCRIVSSLHRRIGIPAPLCHTQKNPSAPTRRYESNQPARRTAFRLRGHGCVDVDRNCFRRYRSHPVAGYSRVQKCITYSGTRRAWLVALARAGVRRSEGPTRRHNCGAGKGTVSQELQ